MDEQQSSGLEHSADAAQQQHSAGEDVGDPTTQQPEAPQEGGEDTRPEGGDTTVEVNVGDSEQPPGETMPVEPPDAS